MQNTCFPHLLTVLQALHWVFMYREQCCFNLSGKIPFSYILFFWFCSIFVLRIDIIFINSNFYRAFFLKNTAMVGICKKQCMNLKHFVLDMLGSLINWESSLKFDACGRSVQVNSYYPFIYQPSHLTAGGYQVTEAWYRIHKSILTAYNCLLVLRVFEIGDLWISKRIFYITFPRIEQMLTGL